jgi:hypothetical protein
MPPGDDELHFHIEGDYETFTDEWGLGYKKPRLGGTILIFTFIPWPRLTHYVGQGKSLMKSGTRVLDFIKQ